MRFTIISKVNDYNEIIKKTFIDLFKQVKIIEEDEFFIFIHEYDNLSDIESIIISFQNDFYSNVICYNSLDLDKIKLDEELVIVKELIKGVTYGIFNLKKLIISTNVKFNKKKVLEFILNKTGIDEQVINALVECDLNTSKAALLLHLHRNTLLYKIDRLKEDMDFDLKHFKDVYVLYYLLENKEDF